MDLYEVISTYAAALKLLDRLIQRFIGHMDIPIHCGFDAGVSQQLLQHFRLHSAFNRTGCIGVAQRVHTKTVDPQMCIRDSSKDCVKTVQRHIWKDYEELADHARYTPEYRELYLSLIHISLAGLRFPPL